MRDRYADFDFAKLRAHRRAEAPAGFPLLRGSANALAIARMTYLDALSEAERIAFADQLSDPPRTDAVSR